MNEYLALAKSAPANSEATSAYDLRSVIESTRQIIFLQQKNAVHFVLVGFKGEDRFFVQPGCTVEEAVTFAMAKANLTKQIRSDGGFRIDGYPTADIRAYTDSAIFRTRSRPRTIGPKDKVRFDVIMQYVLQAGDVVVLNLFGPD